jgi:16S rRNA (guanine1207-N2)-methyltransferase
MASPLDQLPILRDKLQSPLALVLGAPALVARLVGSLALPEVVCYQMDLYQADRLREELAQAGLAARVETAADLWDLPERFASVLYPVPHGGERSLKLDMVEQAFHILQPRGTLAVLSPYESDEFFPAVLKKVFGKVHTPRVEHGTVFWCRRDGNRPRRRHEITFQVRLEGEPSLRFLSRPGVFSYGRFDEGARALVETMIIHPGDRILDIGCGCGTNGIIAGRRSGATGQVTFVDSNLRAVAVTALNASANELPAFQTLASCTLEELPAASFDVVLANPPYYAQSSIAQRFIDCGRTVLRPGGRFYLVTRQADQVGPLVAESFGVTEAVERRGYTVLCARSIEHGCHGCDGSPRINP